MNTYHQLVYSLADTTFYYTGTSIWDETLYKAWSEIVTNLIPNIGLLETHLNNFCRICDADEVVLFERATFLVISHAQASDDPEDGTDTNGNDVVPHEKRTQHFDPHRFEKVSYVIRILYCGWRYERMSDRILRYRSSLFLGDPPLSGQQHYQAVQVVM